MNDRKRYVERSYRGLMNPEGLICRQVRIAESDLYVCGNSDLYAEAYEALSEIRKGLESYIGEHPSFASSFRPVPVIGEAPSVVHRMAEASKLFNVGPMASVAGAVSQEVGMMLVNYSRRLLVENGGDIFFRGEGEVKATVFAGEKAPSINIKVNGRPEGLGLCTSSASVGPSFSAGIADAVCILAKTAAYADAAATALGNRVKSSRDIDAVVKDAAEREEILGIVVVASGALGAWGEIEIG